MSKTQVIFDEKGKPAYAVVPWADFEKYFPSALKPALDMRDMSDEELFDRAVAAGEEAFPAEVADRLLNGDHPVRVFRDYRRLTQKELAEKVGINAMYLSQIETGARDGSTKTLCALADALKVDLDDLV